MLAVWSCGSDEPDLGSAAQEATGEQAPDDTGGAPAAQVDPTQPVLPEGFTGPVATSIPLTPAEVAATAEAQVREAARNPAAEDPALRGYALVPSGWSPPRDAGGPVTAGDASLAEPRDAGTAPAGGQ